MYRDLEEFHKRPAAFSRYTTDVIWTDPHIADQMLRNHIDPSTDLASRRAESIERTVAWFDRKLTLKGKNICDLGCGPGLYATRMAKLGARVVGVDFSANSLDYAKSDAAARNLAIDYLKADYLADPLPGDQDVVSLIYGDLCSLSPDRRHALYVRVKAMLKPGGVFVFDVFTVPQFDALKESSTFGRRLMGGFWSQNDYFGFRNTFLYEPEKISLDRYLILESERRMEIFNWLQHFEPETISAEVRQAGFEVREILDVVTGEPWVAGPREFAVIARVPATTHAD